MSRRAKKQHSHRAPVSGTRSSSERGSQRKQERRKAKPVLAVVASSAASNAAAPATAAADAGGSDITAVAAVRGSDVAAAPAARGAEELAPARAPESVLPTAAHPAAESPLADEALAELELSFFEGWKEPAPDASSVLAEPSQLATDDVDSMLLTPEQQQRRQGFRRQVTALMAGMGAFSAAAVVAHIASLL
jgi:hypothetical protein